MRTTTDEEVALLLRDKVNSVFASDNELARGMTREVLERMRPARDVHASVSA
ncbi:MAG TPA: hypothetical protein VFT29_04620 [Gemmatimonadaceae bacterium]|nr:hypothetical protein [Gemmatimonadaceae bacterium]